MALGIVLVWCAFFAPAARANTYLFSFTVGDVLDALKTARTDPNPELPNDYYRSAYFGLFFQPDPAQIASYSFVPGSLETPNPTDPNAWETSIITDPSSPGLGYGLENCTANCSWAGFYKNSSSTPSGYLDFATVISDAALPGSNIFLGKTFSAFGSPPFHWGGLAYDYETDEIVTVFSQTINTVMPRNSVFTFSLTTGLNLSGAYQLNGYASAWISESTSAVVSTKDTAGIQFSLEVTPYMTTSTPEPSTVVVFASGLAAVAGLLIRRRRSEATTDIPEPPSFLSSGD